MNIKDGYDLTQLSPQPIKWAVEDFMPINILGDISSPPDCGKSTFLLSLLIAMANGEPSWFRRKIINGNVAIIGGEKSSEDVWVRDIHRCGTIGSRGTFTICEPADFLWKWQSQQWVKTKEYKIVAEHIKRRSPVMTVIDTISRAALGYDPQQLTQQTLLAKVAEDFQRDIGGNVLTVSHTNQESQSRELQQRLDYTSRSGGNGYPGWLRWLGSMTTLMDVEKDRFKIDPNMRVVAVAVSKPSEMPVPAVGSKVSPWLFEYDSAGRFLELEIKDNGAVLSGQGVAIKPAPQQQRLFSERKVNDKTIKRQIFVNPR